MDKFKGTGVALVTPFNENGKVDYNGLQKLVEFQINNGTNYLVVQGTTGESVTLNKEEKISVLDYIIEINAGKLPILLGVGGNSTSDVCEKIKFFSDHKIDGFLSVSPYYNKPSQQGIYEHFKSISNATNLPIIIYNVPGRTSSNITADTTVKLAKDFKNVVGVKEASGNLEQIMTIILKKPDNFLVISGDDALTLGHVLVGGDGVISVIANAFAKGFSDEPKYFHIGYRSCTKTYGYVENSIFQIEKILFTETKEESNKVFYIGDYESINIEDWANEIAHELGNSIKRVPFFLIKILARLGDTLKLFNINFPMNSFRLKNMTTNNNVNLSSTLKLAPNLPYTRVEGVKRTINWIKINK